MRVLRNRHWLTLVIALVFTLSITRAMVSASPNEIPAPRPPNESPSGASLDLLPEWAELPRPPDPQHPPNTILSDAQHNTLQMTESFYLGPAAVGDTIEVFTNTWSYSTLGMVYNPGGDFVRYAHESQSSSHNPTVYDVDYGSHTVAYSFALSAQNTSWPWQLDNRTGAGYDFVEGTYFLPDYNGDLSYADDNIVEVDAYGNILNAWEMDDEVGSNDSSDGSEIDSIIDIAVVPGNPPRYFATAAYDDNVVYEIVLTKTNTWWTPNSWRTVATCTVPSWAATDDNLGIDYDAENELLYHSNWDTSTLVMTDLTCQNGQTMTRALDDGGNPIQPFDCPGAGGYNSGVAFIEGSNPPEVWVTDFSSDQTTRCEAPASEVPPDPGWSKWINGLPWDPHAILPRQTLDVITVTDVITAVDPFTLTESWNPDELRLIGVDRWPPVGGVFTGTPGLLEFIRPGGPPPVVTMTKWFRVMPCDWVTTTLQEELIVAGEPPFQPRPLVVEKISPTLHITNTSQEEVYAGSVASFTLIYSNTGGFENNVRIRNTFPITAPFIFADPFPDHVGPAGLSTRWDIGGLAQGDRGTIDVYVLITETVPQSASIMIWDGIFNHLNVLQDETFIEFHANQEPFMVTWDKFLNNNGEPWRPGISITLQTSDTLVVEEHFDPPLNNPSGYSLVEEWNIDHLDPLSWTIQPITYTAFVTDTVPGFWTLVVPPGFYEPVTIIKEFHVRECDWPETVLWETLTSGAGVRNRPVIVVKDLPELQIDSSFDEEVYSRQEATFTLTYSNTGGFESFAWVENEFPPEARFVRSTPPPEPPVVPWARSWDLGPLATDDRGTITVTVEITENLPPSTTIEIWDGIFDHINVLRDETFTFFQVPEPRWENWVNDVPWTFEQTTSAITTNTITVTDVISTQSGMAIVQHWNPDRITLRAYDIEPSAGIILSSTDSMSWEFPTGAPGTITLTKWFRVESFTETYTVVWQDLVVEDVVWERRPVHINNFVVYLPLVLRDYGSP